jgi:hypothetical protein
VSENLIAIQKCGLGYGPEDELLRNILNFPSIISNQYNPLPVPDEPCWVHYGPVSILRNYDDHLTQTARRICEAVVPEGSIAAVSYFKIPSEVHFHVDAPRGTCIGFVLGNYPMRVYTMDRYRNVDAINLDSESIFLLNVRSMHAARRLVNRPCTLFISVTCILPYDEIVSRFMRRAVSLNLPRKYSTPVSTQEDISSLFTVNQEVAIS